MGEKLIEQWLEDRKRNRFVSDLEKWLDGQAAIRSRDPDLVRKHLKVVVNNQKDK